MKLNCLLQIYSLNSLISKTDTLARCLIKYYLDITIVWNREFVVVVRYVLNYWISATRNLINWKHVIAQTRVMSMIQSCLILDEGQCDSDIWQILNFISTRLIWIFKNNHLTWNFQVEHFEILHLLKSEVNKLYDC